MCSSYCPDPRIGMPARQTALVATDTTTVIRPAAVLHDKAAAAIVAELARLDVGKGGVWNASAGLWQRYDKAWDGVPGGRGSAVLVGSIMAVYGTPSRYQITLYRVTVTAAGSALGWTVDALCDDALSYGGMTLATCPRAELTSPPLPDPFKRP